MALIPKPQKQLNKKPVRVTISGEIFEHIESYCKWQGLPSISFFLEHAAAYVLENDKDYKRYRKIQMSDVESDNESGIEEKEVAIKFYEK